MSSPEQDNRLSTLQWNINNVQANINTLKTRIARKDFIDDSGTERAKNTVNNLIDQLAILNQQAAVNT
jgi:hypothetical protein